MALPKFLSFISAIQSPKAPTPGITKYSASEIFFRSVVIIDYGSGNLFSVEQAFEELGVKPLITTDRKKISEAEYLVIPGVGAFGDCMAEINERNLGKAIKKAATRGAFILGICVGAQILFEASEEYGFHKGLGLIPGSVVRIPVRDADGFYKKLPHIGWSSLELNKGKKWEGTILHWIKPGDFCYFVHSFMFQPKNSQDCLANTFYRKTKICVVVKKNRIFGCQFHPEKSGPVGLKIIKAFFSLRGD
jgi:glutamine amidotransferase